MFGMFCLYVLTDFKFNYFVVVLIFFLFGLTGIYTYLKHGKHNNIVFRDIESIMKWVSISSYFEYTLSCKDIGF